MPARHERSARRRWGPGSSLVRSCAARLLLLVLAAGPVRPVVVLMVLLLARLDFAEASELGKGHRVLAGACMLDDPVDHLVLERSGLDLTHRFSVLQIRAARLVGVWIALHQGIKARQHALAIHLQPLGLHDMRYQQTERDTAPGGLEKRFGPWQLACVADPQTPRRLDL